MEFHNYAVAPAGRREFGEYNPGSNISKEITKTVYAGDTTTNVINPEPVNPTKPEQSYFMFLQSTQENFKGEELAITAQTASSKLIAYMGTEAVCCFIGKITGDTIANYGITGVPQSGMQIQVIDNGTTGTTLQITVDSSITQTTGSLQIPCSMVLNKETGMLDDMSSWIRLQNDEVLFQLTLEWNWTIESRADNTYILDLTNEIAGVNCDSGGTVVPGAILPECEGTLFYGTDIMTAATYSYYVNPNYNVSGLTATTSSTGISLVFQSNFGFEGTTLAIKIRANVGGVQVAEKTMNVVKNLPGANGEDAITRWLVPSIDTMVVGNGGTINNQQTCTFRVKMMKQEGGNEPVEDTTTPIYQRFGTTDSWYLSGQTDPSIWIGGDPYVYQDPRSALTMSYDLLYEIKAEKSPSPSEWQFAILSASGTPIEMEGIPWIYNGAKGDSGATGERGAVVRGPYNWYELENQRYSNGLGPNAEDKLWIDILVKDGVYYRCTTSHNYTGQTWAQVQSAWTQSNESYDFIATNLLLAENGKINIMTTNEIYFGSGNTITGGMAGGSGSTPAFWAGNSEAEPNFSVDHNGNLVAKSGKFYGNVYIPFKNATSLSAITRAGRTCYEADYKYGQIISDVQVFSASTISCPIIILPIPTADYYGYTFTFTSGRAFGSTNEEVWAYEVVPYGYKLSGTLPSNQKYIYDFTFTDTSNSYYKGVAVPGSVGIGGGALIKICCMPYYYNGQERAVWGIIEKFGTITNDNY